MPAAHSRPGPSFIGTGAPDAERLARALAPGRTLTCPPTPPAPTWPWGFGPTLEAWTTEVDSLPVADAVVVCTWHDHAAAVPLVELGAEQWRQQLEWPTALWFSTLAAATGRCRDGGSVVAVVDRPATLDAVGQSVAVAVAEGVTNLVRSLAAREGGRSVRVNAVVTSRHTEADGLLGSPPPLASFPGRVDVEVAGAVRALLSADLVGVTGTTVAATCGRA